MSLSILISFIKKYEYVKEQSVTNLFYRLGKRLYNESLYEKYYKENIENTSFIEYRKNFSMKEGEELINLGGTVITYLDMKSDIFNMLERYNVKTKKTHREILPSSPEAQLVSPNSEGF